MGLRGPSPLSSAELRKRGSWRWKQRQAQEHAAKEAAKLCTLLAPLDEAVVQRLVQALLDAVNTFPDPPTPEGDRPRYVGRAARHVATLASDTACWGDRGDDDGGD